MPISFKSPITVTAFQKTPTENLVFCSVCGGINALGNVAVKIDCTACDTTGYSNFYTEITLPAYYTPGGIRRWNAESGAVSYSGECTIKLDARYKDFLDDTVFIEFGGIRWQFNIMEDPGSAMAQGRLILVMSRRK